MPALLPPLFLIELFRFDDAETVLLNATEDEPPPPPLLMEPKPSMPTVFKPALIIGAAPLLPTMPPPTGLHTRPRQWNEPIAESAIVRPWSCERTKTARELSGSCATSTGNFRTIWPSLERTVTAPSVVLQPMSAPHDTMMAAAPHIFLKIILQFPLGRCGWMPQRGSTTTYVDVGQCILKKKRPRRNRGLEY